MLSTKTKLCLIGFLITITIILRFPITSHERWIDSFYIHGLSNSISEYGTAKWIIHPFSIVGLYPLSYPVGSSYFLSSISQSTNLEMEFVILIVSIFIGLLGSFTAFLLVGEFTDNFFAKFFSALTFMIAPRFLIYTSWTFSARALFIALLPLLLWCLIRMHNQKDKLKYIMLSILLLITLATIHRMFILISLVIFAYLLGVLFFNIGKFITIKKFHWIKYSISMIFVIIFILLISAQFIKPQFIENVFLYSPSGDFFEKYLLIGNEPYIIFLNAGIFYTFTLGCLLVFGIIGFIYSLIRVNKSFNNLFLFILLLFFILYILDTIYMILFLLPILIPFVGVGIYNILQNIKIKFLTIPIILILLLFPILFSNYFVSQYITNTERKEISGFTDWIDERTYNTALFIKYKTDGSIKTNDFYKNRMIWAISDKPCLPFTGPELLIYDFANKSDLDIERIELNKSNYPKNIYILKNKEILYNESLFDVRYILVNNYFPTKYGYSNRYWELIESKFYADLKYKNYKIYDDGLESIYLIK